MMFVYSNYMSNNVVYVFNTMFDFMGQLVKTD